MKVYDVTLQQASPRGMAAVRARMPASRVATQFRTCLDQVYAVGSTWRLWCPRRCTRSSGCLVPQP
jgi:hypothetical protein